MKQHEPPFFFCFFFFTTSKFHNALVAIHSRTMASFGMPIQNFAHMHQNGRMTTNFWTGANC